MLELAFSLFPTMFSTLPKTNLNMLPIRTNLKICCLVELDGEIFSLIGWKILWGEKEKQEGQNGPEALT